MAHPQVLNLTEDIRKEMEGYRKIRDQVLDDNFGSIISAIIVEEIRKFIIEPEYLAALLRG